MNLQVGVKVLLRNESEKILVLRRSGKYAELEGVWDIPGGRIEPGTPLNENLMREIQEETGLELTTQPRLVGVQDIFPSKDQHVVRVTYVARTHGDPVLDEEHTEFRWVEFKELRELSGIDRMVADLIETGLVTDSSW